MDLTAFVYDGAGEAGQAARRLAWGTHGTTSGGRGWAVVRWDRGAPAPRTEVVFGSANGDPRAAWFWALVLGVTFSAPLLGAAVGSASALEAGSLAVTGIQDSFVNRLRDEVTPGRSALLVLSTGPEAVQALAQQRDAAMVGRVEFSPRQEVAMLEVLALTEPTVGDPR